MVSWGRLSVGSAGILNSPFVFISFLLEKCKQNIVASLLSSSRCWCYTGVPSRDPVALDFAPHRGLKRLDLADL